MKWQGTKKVIEKYNFISGKEWSLDVVLVEDEIKKVYFIGIFLGFFLLLWDIIL